MRVCCGTPARGEFYMWGKQRRRRSGANVPGTPERDRVLPVPPRPGTAPALAPPLLPHDGGRPGEREAGTEGGQGGGAGGSGEREEVKLVQQEPSRHTRRRTPRKLAAASGGTGLRWPPPQGALRRPAGARCLPGPFTPCHRPSPHTFHLPWVPRGRDCLARGAAGGGARTRGSRDLSPP